MCAVAEAGSTLPDYAVGFEHENGHERPQGEIVALGFLQDPPHPHPHLHKATGQLSDGPAAPATGYRPMPVPYRLASGLVSCVLKLRGDWGGNQGSFPRLLDYVILLPIM